MVTAELCSGSTVRFWSGLQVLGSVFREGCSQASPLRRPSSSAVWSSLAVQAVSIQSGCPLACAAAAALQGMAYHSLSQSEMC